MTPRISLGITVKESEFSLKERRWLRLSSGSSGWVTGPTQDMQHACLIRKRATSDTDEAPAWA
jgi:hypothetical protein